MEKIATTKGYDPVALATATERVVVDGNRRKYVQLGRPLRFYGGTASATEVGCNLRCKFCFSDKPVWKPKSTGRFYTPQQVFDGLSQSAQKHGYKLISASASEGTLGRQHLFELLDLVEKSEYVYILETNGITLGADPEFAQALAKYKRLHVRVCTAATECFMCLYDTVAAAALLYCLAWQYLDHYPFNFYTVLQEVRQPISPQPHCGYGGRSRSAANRVAGRWRRCRIFWRMRCGNGWK